MARPFPMGAVMEAVIDQVGLPNYLQSSMASRRGSCAGTEMSHDEAAVRASNPDHRAIVPSPTTTDPRGMNRRSGPKSSPRDDIYR